MRYRGYPLELQLVRHFALRPVLAGLGRWAVDGEETLHSYIGRAFGLSTTPLLLMRSTEAVLSLPTARLLLSSLIISLSRGTLSSMEDLSLFVEWGEEAQLFGISSLRRYSLTASTESVGEETAGVTFRNLLCRHFAGIPQNALSASISFAFRHSIDVDINFISLGDRQYDRMSNDEPEMTMIAEIQLECIFAQMDPGRLVVGLLPSPFDAPIWGLSLHADRDKDQARSTRIARSVQSLASLLQHAQSAEDSSLLNRKSTTQFDVDDHQFLDDAPLCDQLLLFVLGELQSRREMSFSDSTASISSLWNAFVGHLREHWEDLSPFSFEEETHSHQDSSSSRLKGFIDLLNQCIKRELRYATIPDCPSRPLRRRINEALDSLAAKHQKVRAAEHKERIDKLKLSILETSTKIFKAAAAATTDNDGRKAGQEEEISAQTRNTTDDSAANVEPIDEFFDIIDDQSLIDKVIGDLNLQRESTINPSEDTKTKSDDSPQGRKYVLEGHKLARDDKEPIWVPFTQESPLTSTFEDAMAQLASDMQAFKAANPRSEFEDFIKWHSPRDWVDGQLSTRMATPGNLWDELWKAAPSLPAIRQELLFDHRREAERVLGELESLNLAELLADLLPMAMQFIITMVSNPSLTMPDVIDSQTLAHFCAQLDELEYSRLLWQKLTAMGLDEASIRTLLADGQIIVVQEEQRLQLRTLFEGQIEAERTEMVINKDDQTELYVNVRPFGDIEVALTEIR